MFGSIIWLACTLNDTGLNDLEKPPIAKGTHSAKGTVLYGMGPFFPPKTTL